MQHWLELFIVLLLSQLEVFSSYGVRGAHCSFVLVGRGWGAGGILVQVSYQKLPKLGWNICISLVKIYLNSVSQIV